MKVPRVLLSVFLALVMLSACAPGTIEGSSTMRFPGGGEQVAAPGPIEPISPDDYLKKPDLPYRPVEPPLDHTLSSKPFYPRSDDMPLPDPNAIPVELLAEYDAAYYKLFNYSSAHPMNAAFQSNLYQANSYQYPYPSDVVPGVAEISIKDVLITNEIPEGVYEEGINPPYYKALVDGIWDRPDIIEFLARDAYLYPGKDFITEVMPNLIKWKQRWPWYSDVCYMFVTYTVTNTTQNIIATWDLIEMYIYLVNDKNQMRTNSLNYGYGYTYQGYYDYPSISTPYAVGQGYWYFLRLLPGETREITMGYLIDQTRWIDETSESEWSFLIGYYTGPLSGVSFGWLLDYDKITYVGVERNK